MPHHTLSKGMHFIAGGQEYEILKRLPSGEIQIKNIVNNECSAKPEDEIIRALFDNEIELLGDNRNQAYLKELLKKTGVSDLTLIGEDDPRREEMERHRAYVLEVLAQRLGKLTEESLGPIIKKVAHKRGDLELDDYKKLTKEQRAKVKARPSVSSLIRWVNRYIKSGEDERAFIPAIKGRGNRTRKFSGHRSSYDKAKEISKAEQIQKKAQAKRHAERVGELVDAAIAQVYMNEQRFSVQDVYDNVIVKVADENEMRASDDQLPEPHKSSIYDVVSKLDDYDLLEARYGKKMAEEKYKAFKRGPRPTMPLERVEADHTKLDLFVIDPVRMLPIGRPVLTWLVCVYTKMVLGFYISFNPYGSLAIMECLKHAIRPKTYVRGKYPSITHTWDTYGVMKKLVLDNAPEFWGRHLEDACRQFGINIQYGQKGRAWYRATIERSFRTYNTGLIHRQPGTTFSNIFDRADYDSQKNALITLDTLDEVTHKYIIDILQLRLHRGINDIPALRWEKGVKQWPPPLPARVADLDIVLGYIERRKIHHYGIEIDTIIYNDEDLVTLRRETKSDEKCIIKRNPNDLSKIHVYDKKRDRYLPVLAVDQEYTKELTLYQHEVIRKYVREQLKRNVDIVALCRAKLEVQEIIERNWNRTTSSKVKMARYRKEGVQNRFEENEVTDKDWLNEALGLPMAEARPQLMIPEAVEQARKGISDFESAFDARTNSNTDNSVNEHTTSSFIGGSAPKKAKGTESGSLLKSVERKNASGRNNKRADGKGRREKSRTDKPEKIEKLDIGTGAILDMTGWNADYNLPK
jgi:putative transposase